MQGNGIRAEKDQQRHDDAHRRGQHKRADKYPERVAPLPHGHPCGHQLGDGRRDT